MSDGKGKRNIPLSGLDSEMMKTDPVWGKEVPEELYDQIKEKWGQLGFYTRDLRLGNLKEGEQEEEVNYYLNLAGDCLERGYVDSFMKCLRMAISRTEVSQSRKGFLRDISNTLTYRNVQKGDDESGEGQGLMGKKK